jgi:diguanylate cyclase (GGDEF)-like protein/PAS domain S-box-containing protein
MDGASGPLPALARPDGDVSLPQAVRYTAFRGKHRLKAILLAESSPTRRRALSAVMAQRGYAVTALASLDDAYGLLARSADTAAGYAAVLVGWPEHVDGVVEDVFGLLHAERFEHLPVLVLADPGSAGAVNWRMTRPRTSLLPWADYQEAPDALDQLLRPQAAPRPRLDGGALRILLVDDSATVRLAFARLLQKHGYVVQVAADAAEGLALARREPFDIAVVDYFMPGTLGTGVIAALRADPATAHILCATITGTYSDAVITESLAAGAVECLFKTEARDLFLARLASLSRTIADRKAIDAERRRLEGILASVGDGVYGVDRDGRITFVNPAALDILGFTAAAELVGRDAFEAFHHAFDDGTTMPRASSFLVQAYASGNPVPAWQTTFRTTAQRAVPVECTVFPLAVDGERQGSVVAFRDVSARRLLEEELRWQAEHDALTKLHNRAWFETQLEQEIARLKRTEHASVVLFVDLDRFKYINDTAGHTAGDQLLLEVSMRLKSRLRGSDHLARMGGDEYAVILRNVPRGDAATLAEGFRRALTRAPFVYGGKTYRITVSIGAAPIDAGTTSSSDAMAAADIALHLAKNAGRNRVHVYREDNGGRAAMDLDLGWSARLEEALRADRFVLCYQPMAPLGGLGEEPAPTEPGLWERQLARNPDRPAKFEALLRLREPTGGLVLPGAFLPSAERFGLMPEIDRWVVDRALRTLRDAHGSRGTRRIVLSVNLSAQALASPGFVAFVTDRLVQHDVEPASLLFELSEAGALASEEALRAPLQALRALGCGLAVDDFGSGLSSLGSLRTLDADYLKIDGSLMQGLPDDPLDRAVLTGLTTIARAAGKRTVAECVENPAALRALVECGVDLAQGHAVGLPMLHLPGAIALPTLVAGGTRFGR